MQKNAKVRLDVLLHARGLFPSREAARRAIMAGWVRSGDDLLDKPGHQVTSDTVLDVKRPAHDFVSRGGLKLARALDVFGISLHNRVVVDVGASTGGFTDCALQQGAAQVYAVDVGYGQLAWKIRTDPRVVVMERTNFRHVTQAQFAPAPDIAIMDVSFISTRLLLPTIAQIATGSKDVISLIKPQFEAGRGHIGKGGIVRDPAVHRQVLLEMLDFVSANGWTCLGLDYSPISGGDGNLEFLAWWQLQTPPASDDWTVQVPNIVDTAWAQVSHA